MFGLTLHQLKPEFTRCIFQTEIIGEGGKKKEGIYF